MWLITVRPGPTLHVWCDGKEIAVVPLTFHMALELLQSVARYLPRNPDREE